MRLCKECKHYKSEDFGYVDLKRCHAPALTYREPERGALVTVMPSEAREDKWIKLGDGISVESCGLRGRYFEPKPPGLQWDIIGPTFGLGMSAGALLVAILRALL